MRGSELFEGVDIDIELEGIPIPMRGSEYRRGFANVIQHLGDPDPHEG